MPVGAPSFFAVLLGKSGEDFPGQETGQQQPLFGQDYLG